jgi:hypothetical protein
MDNPYEIPAGLCHQQSVGWMWHVRLVPIACANQMRWAVHWGFGSYFPHHVHLQIGQKSMGRFVWAAWLIKWSKNILLIVYDGMQTCPCASTGIAFELAARPDDRRILHPTKPSQPFSNNAGLQTLKFTNDLSETQSSGIKSPNGPR